MRTAADEEARPPRGSRGPLTMRPRRSRPRSRGGWRSRPRRSGHLRRHRRSDRSARKRTAVANVVRAVPDLPWWRLVPSDGRVYRSHRPTQIPLLRAEGHSMPVTTAASANVARLQGTAERLFNVGAGQGRRPTSGVHEGSLCVFDDRRPRAETEVEASTAPRRGPGDHVDLLGYAAVSSRSVAPGGRIQAPRSSTTTSRRSMSCSSPCCGAGRSPPFHRMEAALASAEALRGWWKLASDRRGTSLFVELLAAAHDRPAPQDGVGDVARTIRQMQLKALGTLLPEYGLDPGRFPPPLVAAAIQGLAFSAVQDSAADGAPH